MDGRGFRLAKPEAVQQMTRRLRTVGVAVSAAHGDRQCIAILAASYPLVIAAVATVG